MLLGANYYVEAAQGDWNHRHLRHVMMPDAILAEFHSQIGLINSGLEAIPRGRFTVRQRSRLTQEHELRWKAPALVPELTHISPVDRDHYGLVILHPCFPESETQTLDPSVPTLRKAMDHGHIALQDGLRAAVLRIEPFLGEADNIERCWLYGLQEQPRIFEWAILAALALAPNPAMEDEPLGQDFVDVDRLPTPQKNKAAPPVYYWRSL